MEEDAGSAMFILDTSHCHSYALDDQSLNSIPQLVEEKVIRSDNFGDGIEISLANNSLLGEGDKELVNCISSQDSVPGQELRRQLLIGTTSQQSACEDNILSNSKTKVTGTNQVIADAPSVHLKEGVTIKQEVGEGTVDIAADGEVLVKEELGAVTSTPQQFIILTHPAQADQDVEQPPTKYLRFEGADGMTYVLAVPDGENGLLSGAHVAEVPQPTQEITLHPQKVEIGGKKVPSVSTANSSLTTSSLLTSTSSTARGKSSHNASTDGINQAWFTTRDDKNALQNEGLKWKQGQWTKEEVAILEENINNYCKEHNIKDPYDVIFERSKEERKDFYRMVALGIQRPLFSVYRRVTRMYDRKNYRGKYTPTETKTLRILRSKYGNDWAAIGSALGRSASSVKDKCRLMKDNCNSGKWFPEEELRLAAAVHKLTGIKPSESITSGLQWSAVAEHVSTRTEKQCRTKWLNYLNWKQQGGADWTKDDDTLLIERISKLNVNNDSEIDWFSLSQDWSSVRSPQWLRGKWWALKRHIPEYNTLDFSTLVVQMKQILLWNVKPKAMTSVRQVRNKLGASSNTSTSDYIKGVIPVSMCSDGSLSLNFCSQDEEGYQAFEVLQSWTPQMLAQTDGSGDGTLTNDSGHIVVEAFPSGLGDGVQQQVIITASSLSGQEVLDDPNSQAMTIQVSADGNLVHQVGEQDLNVMSVEDLHSNTFTTEGEEIVTIAEFHTQVEDGEQDMMTANVFETVTTESGGDIVMGVTSHTSASSLMTSLKDPILMSSSDVDCEKSQNAVLTDENSELID